MREQTCAIHNICQCHTREHKPVVITLGQLPHGCRSERTVVRDVGSSWMPFDNCVDDAFFQMQLAAGPATREASTRSTPLELAEARIATLQSALATYSQDGQA